MVSILIVFGLVPVRTFAILREHNANITEGTKEEKASQNRAIRKREVFVAVDTNITPIHIWQKASLIHVRSRREALQDELDQLSSSCVSHRRTLFQTWTARPTGSGSVSCVKPEGHEIIIDEIDTQSDWLAFANSTVILRDANFRERSRLRIDSSYPLGTTSTLNVNVATDQNDKRTFVMTTTSVKSLRDEFSDMQPEAAVRLEIEQAVDHCKASLGRDYIGVSRAIEKLNVVIAGLDKLSGPARWQRMNSIVRTIGEPSLLATWLDCHRFLCGNLSLSSQNASLGIEAARRHCNVLRFHEKEDKFHGYTWFNFHLASTQWEPAWARGGLIMHVFLPCTGDGCHDGGPHDHPWNFVSKIVRGGMEMDIHGSDDIAKHRAVLEKSVAVQAPQSYFFPLYWKHTFRSVNSQATVTVMLTDPKLPLVASTSYFCYGSVSCEKEVESDEPLVDVPNYSSKLQAISAFLLGESDALAFD